MNAARLRRRFFTGGQNVIIAPSLLSADFACLRDVLRSMWRANSSWLHLDVMDGHFVPNITFGPPLVKSLRAAAGESLFFDAHLMIEEPLRYVEAFANAGAELITFHVEARDDSREVIEKLRQLGLGIGVSIKPGTSAEELFPLLPLIDLVLVMTVEPGFGGQKMLSECLTKVECLAAERQKLGLEFILQVDGGVDASTARGAAQAGAEVLVAGSAVFGDGAESVEKNIATLKKAIAP